MYCWVIFLKLKFEVFEVFKAFKALVDKLRGRKIKVLRNDNGKEYINKKLQNICEENGIQMQHYVPYPPQQNGLSERKNRELKEMATCMLETKYLSPKKWDEATNCVSYFHNIFTHKSLEEKNPFEAWSAHKTNVSHFMVFGSKDWAIIPSKKRNGLKPERKKSIMVGYFEYEKGYKIFDLSSQKKFIERSV